MCIHIFNIYIYIHTYIFIKHLKRALVVQASLPLFSPSLSPSPHTERKKIKTKGEKYTFISQHELAMAYSPSVQYGFYKRLEISLISCLSCCVCFLLKSRAAKEEKKLSLLWKKCFPFPNTSYYTVVFSFLGGVIRLCVAFNAANGAGC